jgi:hypothetical protein
LKIVIVSQLIRDEKLRSWHRMWVDDELIDDYCKYLDVTEQGTETEHCSLEQRSLAIWLQHDENSP